MHHCYSPPHTGGNSLVNGLARQFAQLFPLVCGGVFVRISPRKAERKISVMFGRFKMADEDRQSDKMALTALFSSSFSSKNPSQEI